jgi:para-aminobenzoate synthetase/4-amino-4-deoxychorismate lyase
LFFRIEGDVVTARPMKGTARRRTRSDDDERAGRELVESDKERAENVMIVDLLRNDLSRLASVGSVSVPSLFVAERYETVWQLTSTVQAEIEPWPRGVYCGAIGLIAANRPGDPARRPDATFNVAIRSAVIGKCSGSLEFGAGGGVTWSSEPASEDAELEAKAVVLTEHRPEFQLLETLRVEGTHLVNFDEHLQRLGSSARYFGFGFDLGAIRKVCGVAIEERPSGDARRMRILLSRTGGLHVELHPLEPASTTPLRLAVAPLSVRSDDVFCCHKTTNRSNYERISALHPGADDVLLANERGEVTETCRANLLVRRGDRWFTPPLASGGLAGIDAFALVSSLRGRRCATVHI